MEPIKESILSKINDRKDQFKEYPLDIMLSAFNIEVATEKEYNGRQLLELLQNADDEKSEEVRIDLNTKENILVISNRGESCTPFSAEGIISLMISHLSPKITKKYIGNKGLGFRSIINWSEKIIISSNNFNIEFSREVVDGVFNELFSENKRKEIRDNRNLPSSVNPIPFLSIPKLSDNEESNWTTSISIHYKDQFLNDIKKQINDLKNEILLFLNSIQKLEVIIDDKLIQKMDKQELSDSWRIFEQSNILPTEYWDKENEEEFYDLKIAIQDDLSCNIKEIFSYFPTKIIIDFPFIVHGTFELNSSRNEINDSPKNRYILKELVNLIVSTAKSITKEEVSYKALEMLSYTNPNNILAELGFYEAIDDSIEELNIFPCLDGRYRPKSEVVFIDSLSVFVQKTKNEQLFTNLLIPSVSSVNVESLGIQSYISIDKLNLLSKNIVSIKERAEMIHLFYYTFRNQNGMEFLIDSNKNIISFDDDIYTPSSLDFSIPDFVNIKFINKELFDQLIDTFEIVSNEKSRDLQRHLKDISNIQSFEPAPVLQKIISSTNKKLKEKGGNQKEIIQKMVASLYLNYTQLDKTKIPSDTKIQLLNESGTLENAQDLYLSKSYPSGELTAYLFDGIFTTDEYLADISTYNFDNDETPEDIEQFFLWLGVNKYTKFNTRDRVNDEAYTDFVFNSIQRPERYRNNALTLTEIDNFSKICKNISNEKLILWIFLDKKIYDQLDSNNNSDKFKYDKANEHNGYFSHEIISKPSFILFQIESTGLFRDYFLGNDKLCTLLNDLTFNFEFEGFENYGVNRSDIDSTLLKIGAVDKFDKLSIDTVSRMIKDLPKKAPDGKLTQAVYKLCIKHFEKHSTPINREDVFLFAIKHEEKRYFPLNDVFYNGNIKLPKKITHSKAILNFPRRQNTSNVIEFFGINNLSSLNIEVNKNNRLDQLSNDFSESFEQLKPYILTYRIQDIEEDAVARAELSKLININIYLCENVQYKIDNESFELDDNDYIKDGKNYLIKTSKNITLNELRNEFDFQECFADIVGLVFDIQDTKVFRDMIKEDLSYIEKTIRNDVGSDELIRARELLGISDEYYSFWKTLYTLLDKNYEYESNDELLDKVALDLNLETDITKIDYGGLNGFDTCLYIKALFNELGLNILNFNESDDSYYKIDFSDFHKRNIKQAFESNLLHFKKYLYSWCLVNSKERFFTEKIAIYDHNTEFISQQCIKHKSLCNVDYSAIVQSFVDENFDFQSIEATDIDFINLYEENEKKIAVEMLDGNTEYLSLLYFSDKVDEIKKLIQLKLAAQNERDSEQNTLESIHEMPNKQVIKTNLVPPEPQTPIQNKSKKPYKHNPSSDVGKKESGDKSEAEVYRYLVRTFGQDNVTWSSKDDDSLGYDIKYKNTGSGEWKYVEVKTDSGNKFHVTKNEIDFAKSHKGLYEIFLVGSDIYRIDYVDYEDKDRFIVEGQDFLVFYRRG